MASAATAWATIRDIGRQLRGFSLPADGGTDLECFLVVVSGCRWLLPSPAPFGLLGWDPQAMGLSNGRRIIPGTS